MITKQETVEKNFYFNGDILIHSRVEEEEIGEEKKYKHYTKPVRCIHNINRNCGDDCPFLTITEIENDPERSFTIIFNCTPNNHYITARREKEYLKVLNKKYGIQR